MLRHFKIYQVMLYNGFCQLVPRKRNHAVSDNASVPGQGNIGRTGSHIHQGDIEHTEIFRYRNIHGGNRLQRHIGHGKPRKAHRHIQTVHHIFRQKRHDYFFRDFIRLVALQIRKNLVV